MYSAVALALGYSESRLASASVGSWQSRVYRLLGEFAISQLDPHEIKETLTYLERIAEQRRKKTTATPLY